MSPLTAREREVAALIAAKRTNKQIAAYLGISGRRVRQLIDSLTPATPLPAPSPPPRAA
jgi:DNA-binding CsgD family transcriptional regulator